jgi:YVTN family beta-propeller protein
LIGDQLWVPNIDGDSISIVDTATNAVARKPVGRAPTSIAATAVDAWVTAEKDGDLWRFALTSSPWRDIAFIAFVLIPAVFGLVYFALPFWRSPLRQLLLLTAAFIFAAVVCEVTGASAPGDFAKLAAMTVMGWLFLRYFEDASWVVLVAFIVPWVDAYSVWRGPTHEIVTHRQHVFTTLSFAFPVPGVSGSAKLGLPDLLFFALFLGAAARFRLRVPWTWLCLTASIGGTIALASLFDVGGLPALPLLALGFLLPNADLLWRAVRYRPSRQA